MKTSKKTKKDMDMRIFSTDLLSKVDAAIIGSLQAELIHRLTGVDWKSQKCRVLSLMISSLTVKHIADE